MEDEILFTVTHIQLTKRGMEVTLDVGPDKVGLLMTDFLMDELVGLSWESSELYIERLQVGDGEFVATVVAERFLSLKLAGAVRDGVPIRVAPLGGSVACERETAETR